jgi:hypothetical protein
MRDLVDVEKDALRDENLRKVLFADRHLQLILMRIKPGKDFDIEYHPNNYQFFRFEDITDNYKNGNEYKVGSGDEVFLSEAFNNYFSDHHTFKELKMLQSMTLLIIRAYSLMQQENTLETA